MSREFYQGGKLPHWHPPGATFFITARLHGSIPKSVIEQIKAEYQLALYEIRRENLTVENAEALLPEDLVAAIERLRRKKENEAGKRYFSRFDDFLDSNLNEPHWLRQPEIARLNFDNIHFYAEKYFEVWAFTLMSNHFHLLMTPRPGAPELWKILQNTKKFSGTQSNRLMGRTGPFWEEESYDHWLREGEFDRIVAYILNNPVKAGIVRNWQEYPWNYCHPSLL